jgi:phosphatidylethanolamine/phosphatidyl-N-methylethanolamine N-methyltransferase
MSLHDDDSWARSPLPFRGSRTQIAALASQVLRRDRRRRDWDDFEDTRSETVSTLSFFLKYLKNPSTVGAVVPSSRHLAALMTSEIRPDGGPILELGAGDGIFTAALLDRGLAPEDVVAVELDPVFADRLTRRFPRVTVINAPAERALRETGVGHVDYGAVVSGLPLLNFPWGLRQRLLLLIFRKLRPGGALYQFTYGVGAPVPKSILRNLGLEEQFLGRVYRNIPPAAVFKITRR